ncbi:MAG: mechanosensitive ion channel domain-containing protein [Pseudomonadota bacterium]
MLIVFFLFAAASTASAQSDSQTEDAVQSDSSVAQSQAAANEAAEPAPASIDTALQPLLDVLRDDAARDIFIDALEAATPGSEVSGTEASAGETEARRPLIRRLADTTQQLAENWAARGAQVWRALGRTDELMQRFDGQALEVVISAARALFVTILLTIGLLVLARFALRPVTRRLGAAVTNHGFVAAVFLWLIAITIEIVIVVLAWSLGYVITTLAVGTYGTIDLRQTLYLNAFLIIELLKVGLRAILSPASSQLRLLPMSDRAARRLFRVLNMATTTLGYGLLVAVPLVNRGAGYGAGSALSVILAVLVLIYLAVCVLRYRRPVANWLMTGMIPQVPDSQLNEAPPDAAEVSTGQASDMDTAGRPHRGPLYSLAHGWHWLALVYLAYLFTAVLTSSQGQLIETIRASGQILAAVLLTSMASSFLARLAQNGFRLPREIDNRLPLLEARINAVVPQVLRLIRLILIVSVFIYALSTSGLLGSTDWIQGQLGQQVGSGAISVGLILLVSYAVWLALSSWVDFRLNPDYGDPPTPRETTLLTLLRNAASIAIMILAVMFSLSEMGINIGPLIASAGVVGLAVGFGAQKMVQDIITGIFIQLENSINVGDVITVAAVSGVVEKLTVRSVSLRDVNGVFHIIPFSSVDMVSNFTREFSYFVADIGVAYRENTEEVKQAMFDAFDELRGDFDHGSAIVGDLEWFGLNAFGPSEIVLRARIKTRPGRQWGIGREYNRIIKRIFDERGIEIPFPQQTIHFGEAKDGSTQPIRVVSDKTGKGDDDGKNQTAKDTAGD